MTLEQILDLWDNDSLIDSTDPIGMTENIPRLHSKYLRILAIESLIHKKLDSDFKVLWRDKFEFYTQGPNEVSKKRGWQLPPKGRVIKTEAAQYLEADSDIIALKMKVEMQFQKTEAVRDILKLINNRSFSVGHVVEWNKFQGGR